MINKELYKELVKIDNLNELKEKIKEKGLNIQEEVIEKAYEQFHSTNELSDDELFNVTGGCNDDDDEPKEHPRINGGWAPICSDIHPFSNKCAFCSYFIADNGNNTSYSPGICSRL